MLTVPQDDENLKLGGGSDSDAFSVDADVRENEAEPTTVPFGIREGNWKIWYRKSTAQTVWKIGVARKVTHKVNTDVVKMGVQWVKGSWSMTDTLHNISVSDYTEKLGKRCACCRRNAFRVGFAVGRSMYVCKTVIPRTLNKIEVCNSVSR